MSLSQRAVARTIPCPFCCLSFAKTINLARHVQTSHKNESRCAAAAAAASVTSQSFTRDSMAAMASAPGPPLLDVNMPAMDVTGTADGGLASQNKDTAIADVAMKGPLAGVTGTVSAGGAPHDDDAATAEATPNGPVASTVGCGLETHQLQADSDGGNDLIGAWLDDSESEDEDAAAAHDDAIGAAAVDLLSALPRHVFLTSTAARIRAYYRAFPETSQSSLVVPPWCASRPLRFSTPALRCALRFALTAGGCGLTERDHVAYAQSLCVAEREATRGTNLVGSVSAAFPSAHGFLTAARHEQNRVLAARRWMMVNIETGGRTFVYYYRDILGVALDLMAHAERVSFGDMTTAAQDAVADDPAGCDVRDDHERQGTLDADLYKQDSRQARRIHGPDARVLAVQLHADEALVSWSGAHYIFPLRVNVPNVLDGGGQWQTVGYLQHISKAVEHSAAARLAVSDMRNDLLQRCLAVSLRAFTRASKEGVTAPVAGHGSVMLVPRVLGLVVDQVEERNMLALMGNRCRYFCSLCMEDKNTRGGLLGVRAVDRDVVTTLDAQMAAAVVRAEDARASRRRALGREHSALAFVPALGAVHGLGTGAYNLYFVVSFDLLNFWKLGILRLLAQRLPAVLRALCAGRGLVRLGTVQDTLDILNLRGFELGRNCKVTPSAPEYALALPL